MKVDEGLIQRLVGSLETKNSIEVTKGQSGKIGFAVKIYGESPSSMEADLRSAVAKVETLIQQLEDGTFEELNSLKKVIDGILGKRKEQE